MSSLVMVVAGGLLPGILPCHGHSMGFAGGKARVPSKRAASESGRKAKRRRAAALQKGHLRRWPLQGKSGRRVKKAGFRKPALQLPILPSGAIGGKYVW